MKKLLPTLFVLFLLAGCAAGSTPVPPPAAAGQPTAETPAVVVTPPTATPTPFAPETPTVPKPRPSPTVPASPTPSPSPAPAQPANSPVLSQSSGSLTVQIFSDSDVEVNTPGYLVSGQAPAGTVLSINEEILVVDKTQKFAVEVPLEEGPNIIEIVASNSAGDEVNFILTATYNPQP